MHRTSIVVTALTAAGAAALLTVSGQAFGTFAKWGVTQVPYYVNPANMDVPADVAVAALQSAASAWSAQSNASISMYYAGQSSDTAITYDGKTTVMFRNTSNGSALATTYSWFLNGQMQDADVIFWDGAFTFLGSASPCYGGAYLEDVATHEFGHVLGLLHSAFSDATMYPYYGYCSTQMRTLAADDKAGIEALYPPASLNTPPAITIASPRNATTVSQGTPITFTGSASDATDGDLTSRIVWKSNLDGQIGTGASFSATLSQGSHVITATAADNAGLSGSSQVSVTVAAACVPAAPTVTLSPSPVYAAPGWVQLFTATVKNRDGSTCGASNFSLTPTVPTGWTAALGAPSVNLAPNASASTTLTVTLPIAAVAASYSVGISASSTAFSASASAIEFIGTSLDVRVSTDAASYETDETVNVVVTVMLNGAPVPATKVTLTLTRPDGSTQRWTPTTNASGVAKQNVKISRDQPLGLYLLNATATRNNLTGTGGVSFRVAAAALSVKSAGRD